MPPPAFSRSSPPPATDSLSRWFHWFYIQSKSNCFPHSSTCFSDQSSRSHALRSVLLFFLRVKFHAWQWFWRLNHFFATHDWGYFYYVANMTGSFCKEIFNVRVLFWNTVTEVWIWELFAWEFTLYELKGYNLWLLQHLFKYIVTIICNKGIELSTRIFQCLWIEIFKINYRNPIWNVGKYIHIMLKLIFSSFW